jgi:branched-chain amino acid transport system substrate-binding protein
MICDFRFLMSGFAAADAAGPWASGARANRKSGITIHKVLAVLLLAGCTGAAGDGGWQMANGGWKEAAGANLRSVLRGPPSASPELQSQSPPRPFFDTRSREPNYAGPGREEADPPDVTEVLLGYFGPPSGDMWYAACLAVAQANAAGGYRNMPFRLVPAWSDHPWGAGVKELTRLVFEERVWAVVGGIDGPTTHLAEQVAVKAGLPLLNPVSTDKTVNLINVPWIFSCTPQDHIQARVLAEALTSKLKAGSREGRWWISDRGFPMADDGWKQAEGAHPQSASINPPSRFVLVSATDHDSHLFAVEFQRALMAKRLTCAYHYQFQPGAADANDLVEKIGSASSEAVVILAGAPASAQLTRRVRDQGYAGIILGGPWMGQRAFVAAAGRRAEGVLFPCPYVAPPQPSAFENQFTQRFGRSPDYLAAHSYDAVNMLIAAVRCSGLNRVRIRDALRELSPWPGVSGSIVWDAPGSNCRPVTLCTIAGGRIVPVP